MVSVIRSVAVERVGNELSNCRRNLLGLGIRSIADEHTFRLCFRGKLAFVGFTYYSIVIFDNVEKIEQSIHCSLLCSDISEIIKQIILLIINNTDCNN